MAPGGALREGRSRPRAALPAAPPADAEGSPSGALAEPVPLPVRRRGRRLRRVVVVGVAGAGVAAWVLLASPFATVTRVDVAGASPRWIGPVRAAVERELGQPAARVDTAAVAARVRAVPGVLRASVGVRWPHTLVVRVVERVAAVGVRVPGGVRVYDADGVELGFSASAPAVPLVDVAPPALTGATVEAAVRVRDALPPSLLREVTRIGATSPQGVWFVLRDGTRVVWGSSDDAAGKAAALAILRAHAPSGRAHAVDVSAPDAPAVS